MRIEAKKKSVEEIKDLFSRSTAAVFVDFRGMDVPLISDLRSRFRQAGVEYKVIKNNLVRRALADLGHEKAQELDPFLKGPTAVAWSFEDPSAAAKVIKAFRKEGDDQEKLGVKGAVLENEVLESPRVEGELALLPGKDEIRAQLLAQLLAPAQSLVRQLHAPGQNLAYALGARQRQLEEGGE